MNIEIAITKSYLTALLKMPKNIQKKASELIDKFKSQPEASSIELVGRETVVLLVPSPIMKIIEVGKRKRVYRNWN